MPLSVRPPGMVFLENLISTIWVKAINDHFNTTYCDNHMISGYPTFRQTPFVSLRGFLCLYYKVCMGPSYLNDESIKISIMSMMAFCIYLWTYPQSLLNMEDGPNKRCKSICVMIKTLVPSAIGYPEII
jgi:hypothetical protein